jgi:hypothetical protein
MDTQILLSAALHFILLKYLHNRQTNYYFAMLTHWECPDLYISQRNI